MFSSRCETLGGAGNGRHHSWLRYLRERMALLQQLPGCHGYQGRKAMPVLLAPGESLFVATIGARILPEERRS
jgi:hypothetical protein